jgi:hypothetical protein
MYGDHVIEVIINASKEVRHVRTAQCVGSVWKLLFDSVSSIFKLRVRYYNVEGAFFIVYIQLLPIYQGMRWHTFCVWNSSSSGVGGIVICLQYNIG